MSRSDTGRSTTVVKYDYDYKVGEKNLNAPGTHPYRLVSRTDGVFRFENPSYNPKVKPLIIDLWLCPECKNALLSGMFEEVAGKARKLYSDALNPRKRNTPGKS